MRIMACALVFLVSLGGCSGAERQGDSGESLVTCPDCDGGGVTVTESRQEDLKPGEGGSFSSSKTTETCDRCSGTGQVKG